MSKRSEWKGRGRVVRAKGRGTRHEQRARRVLFAEGEARPGANAPAEGQSQPLRRNARWMTKQATAMTLRTYAYPYVHFSSGMCSKFIP